MVAASFMMAPDPSNAQQVSRSDNALTDLPTQSITQRVELYITGSTSLIPHTRAVVDRLMSEYSLPPPRIELKGAQPGIAAFCDGIGAAYPDIVVSSRVMNKGEFETCVSNGVKDIVQVKIGISALYVVTKKGEQPFDVTPRMFYQAFAAQQPVDGEFVTNPYKKWRELNRAAPDDLEVRLIVPAAGTGTRLAFDNLLMEGGCRHVKEIDLIFAAVDRVPKCVTLRTDRVDGQTVGGMMNPMREASRPADSANQAEHFDQRVIELAEPFGDRMLQLLTSAPPGTIAVMPGSIYLQFADQLQVLTVNGVLPTEERVAQMEYDISTVNYMYFKRGHMRDRNGRGVVRGIREFMAILTSDEVMGMGGILNRQHGLVSVGRGAVVAERRKAQTLQRFTR
jgi:phosphate transport system substrate-binding protein